MANIKKIIIPFLLFIIVTVIGCNNVNKTFKLSYEEANENSGENVYWVCRLMIDKKYRGKG